MKSALTLTCRFFFLLLALGGATVALPGQAGMAKIDPAIAIQLGEKSTVEVLVLLAEQADLHWAGQLPTKAAKGTWVWATLQAVAERSQAPLRQILTARGQRYVPFYLVNALFLPAADAAIIQALALHPAVASIQPNPWVYNELSPAEPSTATARGNGIEWGLQRINAPAVWAQGFTGQGVIIGGQDTGYDWDHPALVRQYRGRNTGKAQTDHNYNWYDGVSKASPINRDTINPCGFRSKVPCDDGSHGTHTMGTMVGDDGAGNQIGVAPGAQWIGCRNMDRGWGSPFTYLSCFQWFLAPTNVDGQKPDPTKAPHVINNSWGCPEIEGCNASNFGLLATAVNNLRQAGIVVVVSAGNEGSLCGTVNDVPAAIPATFAVGATDSRDTIAGFSSRGPAIWNGQTILKPEVAAPGVNVRSCVPGVNYASFSGTSMAGPHVAGAVALLISANPRLAGQVELIESILERSATPLRSRQNCGSWPGRESPNAVYGAGRINVLAAVEEALRTTAIPNPDPTTLTLRLYPNPVSSTLILDSAPLPAPGLVQCFDATGKLIFQQPLAAQVALRQEIPVEQLPAGLYWYRITAGNRTAVSKIIKQ